MISNITKFETGVIHDNDIVVFKRRLRVDEMYEQIRNEIKSILPNTYWDDSCFLGPVFIRLSWHASGTYDAVSKTGGSNGAT